MDSAINTNNGINSGRWSKIFWWFIFTAAILGLLFYLKSLSYSFFHGAVEIFSIIVAFCVFIVAWHARRLMNNNFLLFIGISFVSIALIDLVHVLVYKGSGIFNEANPSTQLWLAARYLQALSFFIAPFFIGRKMNTRAVIAVYAGLTAFLLLAIFYWQIFPTAYIENFGLTPFKIYSEYVIVLVLFASIALLYNKRKHFDASVLNLLIAAIGVSIVSELAFTTYQSVYGLENFLGHVLKVLEFYLTYKAIAVSGLTKPYTLLFLDLKESEKNLRAERDRMQKYLDLVKVMFVFIGSDQKVTLVNKKGCEILGLAEVDIIGRDWFEHFVPAEMRASQKMIFEQLTSGKIKFFDYYESKILRHDGEQRVILWRNTLMEDENGNISGVLSAGEDITDYKRLAQNNDNLRKIATEGEM